MYATGRLTSAVDERREIPNLHCIGPGTADATVVATDAGPTECRSCARTGVYEQVCTQARAQGVPLTRVVTTCGLS